MKGKIETALSVLGVIVLAIFEHVIVFGCAWFCGWIVSLCVGPHVAYGLNMLFGTTRFTADALPIVLATVAVFGGFFRTSLITPSKEK